MLQHDNFVARLGSCSAKGWRQTEQCDIMDPSNQQSPEVCYCHSPGCKHGSMLTILALLQGIYGFETQVRNPLYLLKIFISPSMILRVSYVTTKRCIVVRNWMSNYGIFAQIFNISTDKCTNDIQFITNIKLLHVSASVCHPQTLQNKVV